MCIHQLSVQEKEAMLGKAHEALLCPAVRLVIYALMNQPCHPTQGRNSLDSMCDDLEVDCLHAGELTAANTPCNKVAKL